MQTALTLIRFHYVALSPTRTHTTAFFQPFERSMSRQTTFLGLFTASHASLFLDLSHFLSFFPSHTLKAWGTASEVRQQFSSHHRRIAWSKRSELENHSDSFPVISRKKNAKSRKRLSRKNNVLDVYFKGRKKTFESLKRKVFKCIFHFSNFFCICLHIFLKIGICNFYLLEWLIFLPNIRFFYLKISLIFSYQYLIF